jgi:hypothetical protein
MREPSADDELFCLVIGLCLVVDPGFHFPIQYAKRKRAVAEHFIVEGANIELVAELLLGLVP